MAGVFDYVKSINSGERIELGTDYNQWVINEIFSQYPDCVLHVNMINQSGVSDNMHYDYMLSAIKPRKRPFVKLKKRKRTHEDVLLIAQFYKYSLMNAKQALSVLTDEQLVDIKNKLGIEA
jgi:ABC-type ATPase with predicted acetyltransferase domain